jgi:hypothetical protein
MSITSQARLFAGTSFTTGIQDKIYGDILMVHDFFPTLRPFRYAPPGRPTPMILVQGTIPISFSGNEDFSMPLNIRLLDTYPNTAPLVQIPESPAGHAFAASRFLGEDGTIALSEFYAWSSSASSLAAMVDAIAQTFSATAPFKAGPSAPARPAPPPAPVVVPTRPRAAPAPPPKPDFEVFQVEAESFVNAVNDEIGRARDVAAASMEESAYGESVLEAKTRCEVEIAELEQIIASIPPPEEPPVDVRPAFLAAAEPQAKRDAHAVAQAALNSAFADGVISFDQMIKATREVARKFFADTLYDRLQNG